jgi:protein subunit release factor B
VQLHHIPTGLYVKCQMTRSREQNRSLARRLLAARVDELRRGDQSRTAVLGEWKRKKKASAAKKSRRKYRKLEQEGQEHEDDGGGAEAAGAVSGAGLAAEKPGAIARGEGTTIG